MRRARGWSYSYRRYRGGRGPSPWLPLLLVLLAAAAAACFLLLPRLSSGRPAPSQAGGSSSAQAAVLAWAPGPASPQRGSAV